MHEKTNLLAEAGEALERLETALSAATVERQEERDRLEAHFRQIYEAEAEVGAAAGREDLSPAKDDDEKLIREVCTTLTT